MRRGPLLRRFAFQNMQITQKTVDEFLVIGIAARTTNEQEISGKGVIGNYWGKLFSEQLLDRIPNRVDQGIVAAYADYAGDHTGEYTYLLGARVRDISTIPEGMIAKRIPAGRYAVVTTDRGHVAQVVMAAWQKVWSLTSEQLGGHRAFLTDFEIYDERASNPEDSQVDIYIGLK
jgi:predicted transcriptional regulator YdeE